MNVLGELQQWYQSHCDGDWEHGYGVQIETLDNPGWKVSVDLTDTELGNRQFAGIRRLEHETDWVVCEVRDGKFEGYGGSFMLEEILRAFLVWAREDQAA